MRNLVADLPEIANYLISQLNSPEPQRDDLILSNINYLLRDLGICKKLANYDLFQSLLKYFQSINLGPYDLQSTKIQCLELLISIFSLLYSVAQDKGLNIETFYDIFEILVSDYFAKILLEQDLSVKIKNDNKKIKDESITPDVISKMKINELAMISSISSFFCQILLAKGEDSLLHQKIRDFIVINYDAVIKFLTKITNVNVTKLFFVLFYEVLVNLYYVTIENMPEPTANFLSSLKDWLTEVNKHIETNYHTERCLDYIKLLQEKLKLSVFNK